MFNPKRLIEWRKKRGLTQDELASKVNTTKGTISNYENGHSTPPHETLVSIADVLNVSTDYLLGRTNNPLFVQQKDSEEPIVQFILRSKEEMSPEAFERFSKLIEVQKKAFMDEVDRKERDKK